MLPKRDSLQGKSHIQIEREWKKLFHANGNKSRGSNTQIRQNKL